MSAPQVTMTGNLAFIDLRWGKTGKPWVLGRLACTERVGDGAGGHTEGPTTFVPFLVFGALAEHVAESARVGDSLVVVGRLRQREFETNQEKRTTYEVVAESVGVSLQFVTAKTPRARLDEGDGTDAPRRRVTTVPGTDPWTTADKEHAR
jgi:single-strand DNA-binding protein